MRNGSRFLLISVLLLGAGWLGLRAYTVANLPGFEPRIALRRLPSAEFHGMALRHETPSGTIRIRARRARPGHHTVGFFKFGPSTFVELEDVLVERAGAPGTRWRILGRGARSNGAELVFRGHATVHSPGANPLRRGGVVIDLKTGEISIKDQ